MTKLTNKESEILNITLEECAEVIQCISKVFRFGFESFNPDKPFRSNKMHLEEEIGDLLAMVEILCVKGIIHPGNVMDALEAKKEKLKKWSSIEF